MTNNIIINSNYEELLSEYLDSFSFFDYDLSSEQKVAFEKFKNNENLLLLGAGGTGKSVLIELFQKYINTNFKNKYIYLTATTGIASYNINGMTIHSFMGFGNGEQELDRLVIKIKKNKEALHRILRTDILIIDEISMLSSELFEKINIILKYFRKSQELFGGMQIILSGDFLQLEPVFSSKNISKKLLYENRQFKRSFDKNNTIILKHNYRQNLDNEYSDILNRIRLGDHSQEDISFLVNLKSNIFLDNPIELVSSNKIASEINQKKLKQIDSKEHVFKKIVIKNDCPNLAESLTKQFDKFGLHEIKLKKNCKVLLIKNIDVQNGLVNGASGIVLDIGSSYVKVKFDNGITYDINYTEWLIDDPINNIKVCFSQIPLILAYAITIHKSQSLTLTSASLDLKDCFCNHQVYVALSRIVDSKSVYIKSFDEKKILVNQKTLKYMNSI